MGDELLYEKEEDERRHHRQRGRCHDASPVGRELLHEHLNADGKCHGFLGAEEDIGDEKLVVGHEKCKDRHGRQARPGQGKDDPKERAIMVATVDQSRFLQFARDRVEIGSRHPRDKRQVENRVDDHDRQGVVDQTHRPEQHE
jgi:hypothetical protein